MWGIILIFGNQATFPRQARGSSKASTAPACKAKANPKDVVKFPSSCHCIESGPAAHAFLLLVFHSTFATRISISSSFTGIQLVSTFIAFSKSESNSISRVPSIRAAEAAWRTSRPPWKDDGEAEGAEGSTSPRSMKTSQTRSWAGNGME